MIGNVLVLLGIIKTVIEIWKLIKPNRTANSATQVQQLVEQHVRAQEVQNVGEVVQTLKDKANQNLPSTDATQLIFDVKYRWVLEALRRYLEENRGWNTLDRSEFLLVMQKDTITRLQYIMGFVSGRRTAQEVDSEFDRWTRWLATRSGMSQGLLTYVYDHLTGISPNYIVGRRSSRLGRYHAIGGYLDLSQMKLEVHRGAVGRVIPKMPGAPATFWESEVRGSLQQSHDLYLQISGFF